VSGIGIYFKAQLMTTPLAGGLSGLSGLFDAMPAVERVEELQKIFKFFDKTPKVVS
jgi:hypothetical protein